MDRYAARRRLFTRGALLLLAVLQGGLHILAVALPPSTGISWDARLQARWVERALDDPAHAWSQRLFPEGELFETVFFNLALANIARTTQDAGDVARAVARLRHDLPRVDQMLHHPPFASMAGEALPGGIIWMGDQNLLRGTLLQLAPDPRPDEVARFHRDSAALLHAFERAPSSVPASYAGHHWPVDALFALRSLQLHDQLYGTKYASQFQRWKQTVVRGADAETGLAPSYVHADGRPRDLPRGCALSWSLAVLPPLDPAYAQAQWRAYRTHFLRCALGLCLMREYPPGHDRAMDADSGPIVGGLGMAASGFALAAARAEGDMAAAAGLQRTGELLGAPSVSWWGRRYLGGEVALLDVLALWSKTVPVPPGTPPAPLQPTLALLGLLLFWTGFVLLLLRDVRRAWAACAVAFRRTREQQVLEILAWLALAVHLVLPSVRLAWVLVAWVFLELLSRLGSVFRRRSSPGSSLDPRRKAS